MGVQKSDNRGQIPAHSCRRPPGFQESTSALLLAKPRDSTTTPRLGAEAPTWLHRGGDGGKVLLAGRSILFILDTKQSKERGGDSDPGQGRLPAAVSAPQTRLVPLYSLNPRGVGSVNPDSHPPRRPQSGRSHHTVPFRRFLPLCFRTFCLCVNSHSFHTHTHTRGPNSQMFHLTRPLAEYFYYLNHAFCFILSIHFLKIPLFKK